MAQELEDEGFRQKFISSFLAKIENVNFRGQNDVIAGSVHLTNLSE